MTLRRAIPWVILFVGVHIALEIVFSSSAFAQGVINARCTGIDCQLCNLLYLADSAIKFLIYIAAAIAAIVFAYVGFLFVISGGDAGTTSRAKSILMDVLLGFIVALIAFVLIDTLIQSLAAGYLRGPSWHTVSCSSSRVLGGGISSTPVVQNPITTNPVVAIPNPTPTGTPMGEQAARDLLAQNGITVTSTGNCSNPANSSCTALNLVNQNVINAVVDVRNASGQNLAVSGGNEVGHQSPQQQSGNSVDLSFTNQALKTDGAAINSVIQAAAARGQCAIWEPGPGASCPTGVTTNCMTGVGTSGHFSLYMAPC